jgi:hypothetical protein
MFHKCSKGNVGEKTTGQKKLGLLENLSPETIIKNSA